MPHLPPLGPLLRAIVCDRYGHDWSWPLAQAYGHTTEPMCTICHTRNHDVPPHQTH